MALSHLSATTLLAYLPLLFIAYILGLAVYRKTLHPLAKIPGPLLASTSYIYQTYFCIFKHARFYDQIDKLHKIYGPVVRITPDEIHLSDPENYEKIYYMGTKYWKSPQFYDSISIKYATFTTARNEVHAIRRAALNPLFSRKRVVALEEVIQSKIEKVVRRMREAIKENKPLDVHHCFRAISIDVITDYAFDKSYDILDSPDLGVKFFEMIQMLGPTMWIFQQWPWLQPFALQTPKWLADLTSPALSQLMNLQIECVNRIEELKEKMRTGKLDHTGRTTIFQHLLTPGITEGYVVPTTWQLKDESYSVLGAAADTTGNCMTVACFHICSQPETYRKLVEELMQTFPDPNAHLDFLTLEKLPYLTGVIKEALRLSFGVIGRLPRVTPEGGATFNGYTVPEGTIVGMSSWVMHRNENVFPDAVKFEPERWLDPERARVLEKHIVPFGKGSRQCVGMPLAYCELYVSLGTFFHRFHSLRVHNCSLEDLVYDDYFSSYHPFESRKLHVISA